MRLPDVLVVLLLAACTRGHLLTAADDTSGLCTDGDGDGDGDGACAGQDCDDLDPAVLPGAPELCNGVDDDCDGLTDEADPDVVGLSTWYFDRDSDGWGDHELLACSQPGATVAEGGDCDDRDARVNPGADEVCDGIDDDCDGLTDGQDRDLIGGAFWCQDTDRDGYGDPSTAMVRCRSGGDYVADCTDCDDRARAVHPHADEVCDGIDDDCDGLVDDQDPSLTSIPTWYTDADGDGYGDARVATGCTGPVGATSAGGDCDDGDVRVSPGAIEVCNGIDDDCDGLMEGQDPDLADGTTWCQDADRDGSGDRATTVVRCSQPTGYTDDCSDCDDTDADVIACPGLDDGTVCASLMGSDDGLVPTWGGDCDATGGFTAWGGHCYFGVSTHTIWPDARASCIAAGGYLATATDASENAFIQSLNSRPYLGACDGEVEGTWTWITGETWSWATWGSGEPNDFTTGEDCLEIGFTSGLWNDIWCDHYSYGVGYVCEFEGLAGDTGEP